MIRLDIILVGLRDYQDQKADVIMKYNSDEARRLKNLGHLPDSVNVSIYGPLMIVYTTKTLLMKHKTIISSLNWVWILMMLSILWRILIMNMMYLNSHTNQR